MNMEKPLKIVYCTPSLYIAGGVEGPEPEG